MGDDTYHWFAVFCKALVFEAINAFHKSTAILRKGHLGTKHLRQPDPASESRKAYFRDRQSRSWSSQAGIFLPSCTRRAQVAH